MKNLIYIFLLSLLTLGCTKEEFQEVITDETTGGTPFGPAIDTMSPQPQEYDSSSFLSVYELVFKAKCGQPACHDGSFEPDFRSPQSSYNTLVFHDVVKNDAQNSYTHRVVPSDLQKSWLWNRITTEDGVLGRMPLYDTLADWQIEMVKNWIANGAKDMFNNTPSMAPKLPSFYGIVAYEEGKSSRLDSSGRFRVEPFKVPSNKNIKIWVGLYDEATVPQLYIEKKAQLSKDYLTFSNAKEYTINTETAPTMLPALNNQKAPFFMHFTFNSGDFAKGDIVYIRLKMNDGGKLGLYYYPEYGAPPQINGYLSFIIE